jgi:hypothetical protein
MIPGIGSHWYNFIDMKTLFELEDRYALIMRVRTLTGGEQPLWGKMTISQMVEHCIRWEEMMIGERKVKHVWLGYLFGKVALKDMIGDGQPVKQSIPTFKELKVEEAGGDFEQQKEKWIGLLRGYQDHAITVYHHPFFGKMTREETGRLAYKHNDHHLRQVGR